MRVLIADDEIAFSSALTDLVRSCGHEVVGVVHSGLDAIRAYRQHRPDIVLMDFAMARLNGLTACRNILSDDPDGCILFLSGFGERSDLTPNPRAHWPFCKNRSAASALNRCCKRQPPDGTPARQLRTGNLSLPLRGSRPEKQTAPLKSIGYFDERLCPANASLGLSLELCIS